MLPAQPNQSLIDGLALLQTLAGTREPIGSRELARQLGLDATRVNRLLKTLAAIGLAEQDERRKYRPGPAIHVLAAQSLFGSGLIRRALGPLTDLHRHGHIVAMGVLWRDQSCYLYHADADSPGLSGLGRTGLYPATSSGIGMALLAYQSEAAISGLYGEDTAELLDRLAQVREQGYALTETDYHPHRTVAVTLGDLPYAAIGLSGVFPDADIPRLVQALGDAADEITMKGDT